MEDYAVAPLGIYFERHLGRFNQRYIMIYMSYRGIESHRIGIRSSHIAYHALHIVVVTVGFIIGKLPHYQTSDTAENTTEFQLAYSTSYSGHF